jgi:hypothetical protein
MQLRAEILLKLALNTNQSINRIVLYKQKNFDIGGIVDNHFKFSFHNTTVGICFPANELFVNKIELQNFICLI